jgi:hypothetical protein
MDSLKNIRKSWISSLSFLDNNMLNCIIVFILLLFCSTIFDNINSSVGSLYNLSVVKLIVLLLIIYISPKDTTIAILLAIAYVISIYYMNNNEHYEDNRKDYRDESNKDYKDIVNNLKHDNSNNDMKHNMRHNELAHEMTHKNVNANEPFAPLDLSGNGFNEEQLMGMDNEMTRASVMTPEPFSTNKKDRKRLSEKKHNEHFFPMSNLDDSQVDTRLTDVNMETKRRDVGNSNNVTSSCMDMYVPQFESVGNVCDPTATFKGELNAQGLNFPEGFGFNSMGSPL